MNRTDLEKAYKEFRNDTILDVLIGLFGIACGLFFIGAGIYYGATYGMGGSIAFIGVIILIGIFGNMNNYIKSKWDKAFEIMELSKKVED